LPFHTRRRATEAVLSEILGLHNKPKAAVRSVHKLTDRKEKRKKKKRKMKKRKKRRRRKEKNKRKNKDAWSHEYQI